MDACGNETVVSQTVTVEDTKAPVFDVVPADKTIGCGDAVDFDQVEVSDACSSANVTFEDETTQSCDGTYTVTRTWTAVDGCGNTSEAKQAITVEDATAPVFDFMPADQTVACGDVVDFGQAVVSDACSAATLTFEDETIDLCAGAYEMTRTWTATDACGNTAQATQKITVEDVTPPVFETTLDDQFINCGEQPVFADVVATDACSNVDITFADTEEVLACETIVTRTWTASDACGNERQMSQAIHIQDNDAPVLEPLPSNMEMTMGEFTSWLPPSASATDCGNVTIDVSNSSESNCDFITHTFNYVATDDCGNSSSHTLEVLITDAAFAMSMEAPTEMDCGEDYEVSLTPTNGTAPFTYSWEITAGTDWQIDAMAGEPMATVTTGTGDAVLVATITDAVGCETSQEITLTCEGAVNAVTFDEITELELLPNPVSDVFYINFESALSGDAVFKTVDALGRVMNTQSAVVKNGLNQFEFDANSLPAGTYLLLLQMDGKTAVERFVKM
jgi:predicted nucleic acid-binding Zn ribbon protein